MLKDGQIIRNAAFVQGLERNVPVASLKTGK